MHPRGPGFKSRPVHHPLTGSQELSHARYTLLVQPLTRLDESVVDVVYATLSRAFKNVEVYVAAEARLPPMEFFDWERLQYRSEYIVEWLAALREKLGFDIILGIGELDAYADGLNFVFGEAYPAGRAAAVYLRRLHPSFYGEDEDMGLFLERVSKEVLHELGHVFGLPHCSNRLCVMSFSNSIREVDIKTSKFCKRCASLLRKAGVILSPEYILDDEDIV